MNLMLGLTTPAAVGLPNPLHPGAMEITAQTWRYIQAISLGSVFFGANTYIGNGPNFMVKSIAEQSGVECPSFFGYIVRYSLPILIPIFAIVWYFFFRM
jgi:Na+/H+ antiporter NhaD/arsenite permease-like protein